MKNAAGVCTIYEPEHGGPIPAAPDCLRTHDAAQGRPASRRAVLAHLSPGHLAANCLGDLIA